MPTDSTDQPATIRWCLGLKSAGVRPMTPDDVRRLELDARVALLKLVRVGGLIVASVVALTGSVLILGGESETAWYRLAPAILLLVAGGAFLPAAALLVARDGLREWKLIRADLRTGTAEQFRADPPAEGAEPATTAVPATPEPAGKDARVVSVDVVLASQKVLLINGAPPERPFTAQVYESAPIPGQVALFSLPTAIAEQLPPGAEGDGRIDRRRLTAEERAELASVAQRIRRRAWVPLAFQTWILLAGTTGLAGMLKQDDLLQQWPVGLWFTTLVIAGVIGVRRMVRQWSLSKTMEEDLSDGWVLVLHGQTKGPSPVEVLPRSQLLWSLASMPGSWRLTAATSRR